MLEMTSTIFCILLFAHYCESIGLFQGKIGGSQNNVCKNLEDYLHPVNNDNCWYNPDTSLIVPDLIMKYFGVLETYKTTTHDGYILTMFRIPRKNPKGVILLQHPISTNSNVFVLQGNESLAYFLWNEGYEIWLNNERGTQFSLAHRNLSAFEYEYWDFSFHEIALYDMPKEIELIRSTTNNSKITFVGHSMGTTVGIIYAALYPESARNALNGLILSGITCYYKYNTSPVITVAKLEIPARRLAEFFRLGNLIPIMPTIVTLFNVLTRKFPITLYLIQFANLFFVGKNAVDFKYLNFDTANMLQEMPLKAIFHLFQLMTAKTRFQWFDYGKVENLKRYGTTKPPLYPIENITVPTFIMYGTEDIATTKDDSLYFYEQLDEKLRFGTYAMEGFNHADFHFGHQRKEKVNQKIIDCINKITSNIDN